MQIAISLILIGLLPACTLYRSDKFTVMILNGKVNYEKNQTTQLNVNLCLWVNQMDLHFLFFVSFPFGIVYNMWFVMLQAKNNLSRSFWVGLATDLSIDVDISEWNVCDVCACAFFY